MVSASNLKDLAKQAFSEFGKVPLETWFAADCVFHELPEPNKGLDAFNAAYGPVLGGATDVDTRLLSEPLIDGDRVSVVFETTMTHSGEIMGAPGTGSRLTIRGVDIARWQDGKMVERWEYADFMGLMQQLGLMPSA